MAGAGHPIQNNAGNVDLRVELKTPQHHGRHGTGALGAVNNENDRGFEKLGQFRGAGASFHVDAVIKASVSFDDGKVSACGYGDVKEKRICSAGIKKVSRL